MLDSRKIDLVANGVRLVDELEMNDRLQTILELTENSVPLHPRIAVDVIHHFRDESYREELHARSEDAGSYYALYNDGEMILILRENAFSGRQFVLIGYYWLREEEQAVLDQLTDEYGSDAFPFDDCPFVAKKEGIEDEEDDDFEPIQAQSRPRMERVSFKALNERAPSVPIVERPRRRAAVN